MLRISKNAKHYKNCWEIKKMLRISLAENFKNCWDFYWAILRFLLSIAENCWEMLIISKNRWVLLRITQYCWELLDNTIQKLCVRPWHINWIRPWWIRGHSVKAVFFLYKALGTTDNTKAKILNISRAF